MATLITRKESEGDPRNIFIGEVPEGVDRTLHDIDDREISLIPYSDGVSGHVISVWRSGSKIMDDVVTTYSGAKQISGGGGVVYDCSYV